MPFYTSLALSYRRWYYRMTTAKLDRHGPALGFSALQCLNIFSLQLLLPAGALPAWLFVAIPSVGGIYAYWFVGRIYLANPETASYAAKLTDSVPGFNEFPAVYAYIFFTVALVIACLSVAVSGAA